MKEDRTQKGNLDMESVMQGTTDEASSSTDAFFDSLESDVNSVITQNNSTDKEQVTPSTKVGDPSETGNGGELVEETKIEPDKNWEKRYSDSDRKSVV